jgi:hypothetical protein
MTTTTKTPAQLHREIAWYRGVAIRSTDRARIRKAHAAIALREQQLRLMASARAALKGMS